MGSKNLGYMWTWKKMKHATLLLKGLNSQWYRAICDFMSGDALIASSSFVNLNEGLRITLYEPPNNIKLKIDSVFDNEATLHNLPNRGNENKIICDNDDKTYVIRI